MAEKRVQRKLAAILAADVVGYSRMMHDDEAGTLSRLKTLREELLDPKVAEYGGRIVKTTGDGVLVEFPSAVDAVQHAVDVQQAMAGRNRDVPEGRRIQLRMGVNLGDVIVDGDDIYGDGVNVAARLEGLAEPSGVCISGVVYESVHHNLGIPFTDIGEQMLKNIPQPVRAYQFLPDSNSGGSDWDPDLLDALLRRPAVAVLPFENMSDDSEQEYFADGLTEDIITALSLWRSFPVIARNSTFAYKGISPDVRKVVEELGARYVVEGSVRKAGNRVRINAQLINAETGHHVWAERYDRDLDDIFVVQDEVTQKIAAIVAPALERAEHQRSLAKPPASLDAWDCYLRGMSFLNEFTADGNAQARALFERAIQLDSSYSRAYSGLAHCYYRDVWMGTTESRETTIEECLAAGRTAIALDDSDSFAHFVMSRGLNVAGRHEPAIAQARIAVELNPNDMNAHLSLGNSLMSAGRPEEGIPEIELGIRLNPRDPRAHTLLTGLSCAYICARRYEDAVTWARKASDTRPNDLSALLILASSLGHAGDVAEGRAVLDECERIQPGFAAEPWPVQFLRPSDAEHIFDGLRKAGLGRAP